MGERRRQLLKCRDSLLLLAATLLEVPSVSSYLSITYLLRCWVAAQLAAYAYEGVIDWLA